MVPSGRLAAFIGAMSLVPFFSASMSPLAGGVAPVGVQNFGLFPIRRNTVDDTCILAPISLCGGGDLKVREDFRAFVVARFLLRA